MANSTKKNQQDSDNILNLIMFRYFPYWPLFVLLVLVSVFLAWTYINNFAVPAYKSTATILVKDEKKGVEDSKTMEALNAVGSKKIVENEVEVISSRQLMRQVVVNLNLYAPVFEEDNFRVISAYVSSPVMIDVKDADNIVPQKKVYFLYNESDNQVVIGKDSYVLDKWVTTPFGVLKFRKNDKKATIATHRLFFALDDVGRATNGAANALTVTGNKLSSVVSLTFVDEVPRRGKDVLNELIRVYNQSSVNEKNVLAASTIAFLSERIKESEKQIDSIEEKIQNFKATRGVVDLTEQGKSLLQNLGANDTKLTDINTQLTVLDQVEQYVVAKDNKGSLVPATLGVNDPILSNLLANLYTAETQYEKLKKTTAENDQILSSVVNEIERIRPNILETIRSQRKNLQAAKNNLSSTNSNYTTALQTIPGKERELVEISRQKEIKNQVFAFLLQKKEETQLKYANQVPDSKIIDAAEASAYPVSPKILIIYLGSVMLAALLGIAYVTIREFLSNKIIFRTEIEEFTSVPVIAEITHVAKRNIFTRNGGKKAKIVVAEQFRQLRMALRLYRKQATKKRLMITSSIGGEGKSFVSSNTAKSLASSGKKVVLIDFDMRNPKTSALFNLTDKSGVKEFLDEEKGVNLKDLVQKTEHDNLYVIPAGEPAINPTELLLSSKLGELFTYLEDSGFDYIIADTAPIQPVTDAYIISEFCDTTLFVVRHRYTPKTMIKLLDENNKIKALKNLNIVFNGVKSRGMFSRSYGYGYGYGYEYGYADRKYIGHSDKE